MKKHEPIFMTVNNLQELSFGDLSFLHETSRPWQRNLKVKFSSSSRWDRKKIE